MIQGYLKAVEKEQIIEWMRAQSYLRLSDLQEYLKKQYDVVFDILQSYYNLLKEAGITWKKLTYRSSAKNDELVKAKQKVREELLRKWQSEVEAEKLPVSIWLTNLIYYGVLYKAILGEEQMKKEKFRLKMKKKDKLIMEPIIIKLRDLLCNN